MSSGDHSDGQRFAYDFGAVRVENDQWTSLQPDGGTKKNEDRLVWGMPVYAVTDGEITAAWRNAHDNTPPGTKRPEVTAERDGQHDFIGLGGNHLNILDPATGVTTENAHFIAGSIPERLVRNHVRFLRTTADNDIDTNRPTVRQGDSPGLAGNSGNSSGPRACDADHELSSSSNIVYATALGSDGKPTDYSNYVRARETINYPFQSSLHPALLRYSSVE